LHRESRMLGDVKFHSHQGIDARVAERWREGLAPWPLAPETWALAAQLGYDRPAREGNGHGPKIKAIPRGKKNIASLLAEVERLSEAEARSGLRDQPLVTEKLNNE